MDYPTLLLLISFLGTITFFFISTITSKYSKLPPGPPPYPIIGNILEFGNSNPLHSLTHLSKIYGPIMTLKLGTQTTIVISSSELAKEVLHTNDNVFSSRTIPDTARVFDHHKVSVAWLPTSTKWRTLRRACATKLFSPQQLDSTKFIREKKVQDLINYVHECCDKGEAFNFGEAIFGTILNSISSTFFSMDLFHYYHAHDHTKPRNEFKELVTGIMEEAGSPNISDFFPFFRIFDLQGVRARMTKHYSKLLAFLDGVMEERLRLRASESKEYCKDVLDLLLNLIKEENSVQLSHHDILVLFMNLFVAGIDTTSSTVEWAMAELLRSPEKLLKVREELQQVLGEHEQLEESQTSKLPYLNAVVKETFRLHPPAPLLVPHKSNDNAELAGFRVPKNAKILVNVWSIGRDSRIWSNPNLFEPERFLKNNEIDFKGRNFELIPFGSGRRICPGLPLASRAIHFVLASLLHHFNWKLAKKMKPEDIDMSYRFGLSLHKAQPLRVVPVKV